MPVLDSPIASPWSLDARMLVRPRSTFAALAAGSPSDAGWRVAARRPLFAGVTLGAVSWIPMAVVVAAIIRAGDEFERRIHLVALALSFGSALLLLTALDWLVRADFLSPPPLMAIWLAFTGLWVFWLFIVKRRFERNA